MRAGKGLWGNKAVADKSDSLYIGNAGSRRFHNPDCAQGKKIYPKNRKNFTRLYDAFYHGYAPCKRCIVMP
jgi:micrococcal nuclease